MREVNITITEDQYKTLIKLLFIVDYLKFAGAISHFKETQESNRCFYTLEKIYKAGAQINLPEQNHIWTTTPLIDKDFLKIKKLLENDLDNIAKIIFSEELAKRDLHSILLDENIKTFHTETHAEINRRWIKKAAKKYLNEFKINGIQNLRFKLFYRLHDDDE